MTTPAEPRGTEPAATTPSLPEPADHLVVTEHSITLGGRSLNYVVTTGTLVLREEAEKQGQDEGVSEGEKPRARVFFIAYTLRDPG